MVCSSSTAEPLSPSRSAVVLLVPEPLPPSALAIALSVDVPAMPSGEMPFAFWNFLTAACVREP